MKKLSAAGLLGLLLLFSISCSSTPDGTIALKDLQKEMAQKVGQNVVVVGNADMRTTLSSFKVFKIYKGSDSIYFSLPEGTEEPPQGVAVRVTGVVQEKEFPGLPGKTLFIEASKVVLE